MALDHLVYVEAARPAITDVARETPENYRERTVAARDIDPG